MEPWKVFGFIAASFSGDCLSTLQWGIKPFVVHVYEARSLDGHVAWWARGLVGTWPNRHVALGASSSVVGKSHLF